MKTQKIILDRQIISSNEIASRRNFNQILNQLNAPPSPFWKSIWFWGSTGIASLALLLTTNQLITTNQDSLTNNLNNNQKHDNTSTFAYQNNILPEDTECIKNRIASVNVPFEIFDINPVKDTVLITKNGSIIELVANSFELVQKDENIIFKVRTFEDKTSAFLAGIPMDYEDGAFESAGMIEMRAEQKDKQINLKPNQELNVSLSLFKSPEGFNFYALDDKSGKWNPFQCSFDNPIKNDQIKEDQKRIEALKNELNEIKSKIKILDAELGNILDPKKEFYYLPENENRIFSINFDPRQFPELVSLGDVLFEALPDQLNFENIFLKKWGNVKISDLDENYKVEFTDKIMKEELIVRPIVTGEILKEKMKEYNMAIETAEVKRKQIEEKRNRNLAMTTVLGTTLKSMNNSLNRGELAENNSYNASNRLVKINNNIRNSFIESVMNDFGFANFRAPNLGTFNCDKRIEYPEKFQFPNEIKFELAGLTLDNEKIFVFDLVQDARFEYGSESNPIEEFGLSSNTSVVMIVFENEEIAYTKTNRKFVLANDGVIHMKRIPASQVNEQILKSILSETRVSA